MTEHYVTLFDAGFLPNGLALHRSLTRNGGDFALWVLCMDETTEQVLGRLALPNVRTLSLAEAETPDLRAVRPGRSRGEYSWTMTPFTPDLVFDRDGSVQRVTYVDADMWLARDPTRIFTELDASGASVLITEHAYAPEYEQSISYGIYCVQFMPFTRDGSEGIRRWWQERVVEWCFATPQDGRFGDQKYLDDWPHRFEGLVHVLAQQDQALAPWNATRFPIARAVFFHFHGLRILPGRRIDLSPIYPLPTPIIRHVYEPYVRQIGVAAASLGQVGFTPRPQAQPPRWSDWLRRCVGGARQQLRNWHRLNFRAY